MTLPIFAAAMGLAEFVPNIAKWLAGDKGESVAEQVVKIARQITQTEGGVEAIQAMRTTPESLVEFQKAMLKFEADLELGYLQDRHSARQRDMALFQAGRSNRRADIMVVSAALGLVMCLGSLALFGQSLPGEAVGIISTIAGIFGACLKDAYAFEFGSSRGSKDKDSTMAAMVHMTGGY
jgi:hypothetical protein